MVDAGLRAIAVPAAASAKPRLGRTSARLVRKLLSMALEEAVQREYLARNPVPLTRAPRRAGPAQQLGWTVEEARSFLAATAGHRLYAAFHISLVTGLRRREVLALRWSDVELDVELMLNTYTHAVSAQHYLAGERLDALSSRDRSVAGHVADAP